jgi:hypothetical protein
MTIVSALITGFGRLIGQAATTTVGWATLILFGRVPESKQTVLALITFGSVVWIAALVALPLPFVQVFVWSTVPRPASAPIVWLWILLLIIAIGLPLLIGLVTARMIEPDRRPTGVALIWQILRGYAWTSVIALMVIFLAALGSVRKVRSAQLGWESDHLPVIVKPGRYEAVVLQVDAALKGAGLDMARQRAPRSAELPLRALTLIADRADKDRIPERLVQFHGHDLSILVLPSDIALLGRKEAVVHARAAIARRLPFTDAYLTCGEETERVEDRLAELARRGTVAEDDFRSIDQLLATLVVPYDVWETLYRLRLQVQHDVGRPPTTPPGRLAAPPAIDEPMPVGSGPVEGTV